MHHILAATTDNNADVHSTPLTSTQYQSLPLITPMSGLCRSGWCLRWRWGWAGC